MKKLTSLSFLPGLIAAAGLTGAFARAMMYRFLTQGGLLARPNPMQLLCLLLTAAVALCLAAALKKQPNNNSYGVNFPRNGKAAAACFAAAAGIVATVLPATAANSPLSLLRTVLGLLSVPALAFIGLARIKGKRPQVMLYGTVCLFYAFHMILRYQSWSANPQLADYCFTLAACACLTLGAYHRAALCAKAGSRRAHLFFSLMAGFFCLMCLPGAEDPWLYLTGAALFLGDLRMVLPRPRKDGSV